MAQALTRWQHPVALNEALDVLHWVMHSTLYRCICMAIEILAIHLHFPTSLISLLATNTAKNYVIININ